MKVTFTPSARKQFLAAVAYIRKERPSAAAAFVRKTERALHRLARYPHSGRAMPEFPDIPFREVIVAPYRFFYKVDQKTVWIVAVWHGRQETEEPKE